MNIIFFEVDGVLTNREHSKKMRKRGKLDLIKQYDNKSVEYLHKLMQISNSSVILVQEDYVKDNTKNETIKKKLRGKDIPIQSIQMENSYDEAESIIEYLKMHNNIDNYVILAYNKRMFDPSQRKTSQQHAFIDMQKHIVCTQSGTIESDLQRKDGFMHKHFMNALHILMGKDFIYEEGVLDNEDEIL